MSGTEAGHLLDHWPRLVLVQSSILLRSVCRAATKLTGAFHRRRRRSSGFYGHRVVSGARILLGLLNRGSAEQRKWKRPSGKKDREPAVGCLDRGAVELIFPVAKEALLPCTVRISPGELPLGSWWVRVNRREADIGNGELRFQYDGRGSDGYLRARSRFLRELGSNSYG